MAARVLCRAIVTWAPFVRRNHGVGWAGGLVSQRSFPSVPSLPFKSIALLSLLGVSTALAQESAALIDALIRKGILTNQEAEDIRADLVRESNTVPAHAFAGNKSTDRLSVGMRMHLQYAHLDTDVPGAAFNPPSTDHFFTRRMYLTLKAGLGANWGAIVTFDFAGSSYDDANIDWHPSNDLTFTFGLRKVAVCYEERASSGNIKAIERSSVTRYFVESNNGRRLGAGSYRIGAFLDGKRDLTQTLTFVYTGAVTSPERNETWSGASLAGDATNNQVALWSTVALAGKLSNGTWTAGLGAGYLPDQGGFGTANLGRGFDLSVYTAFTDITAGRFGLMAEYLMADVARGGATAGNPNARPHGFYIQPSFLLTDSLEAVVRYAWLNSDHRGVNLSDVVRSAPGGGIMNTSTEWFAGANWYFKGNDLKYQLGAVFGRTRDTLAGAPAEAKAAGVRSQLQMQF
jgi:phosphate-selective porin